MSTKFARFASIEERMRFYEAETAHLGSLFPLLPYIVRVDGSNFHRYTEGLERPHDLQFLALMHATAKELMTWSKATYAFTFSDEISLFFKPESPVEHPWMGGVVRKLLAETASKTAAIFDSIAGDYVSHRKNTNLAHFDAHIAMYPREEEAGAYLAWREECAIATSVKASAHHHLGYQTCRGQNLKELRQRLDEAGFDWWELHNEVRNGAHFRWASTTHTRPSGHVAAKLVPSSLPIVRFSSVKNKAGVIFHSEDQDYPPAEVGDPKTPS